MTLNWLKITYLCQDMQIYTKCCKSIIFVFITKHKIMILSLIEILKAVLLRKLERAKEKGRGLKGLKAICSDKGREAITGFFDLYEQVCEFIEDMEEEEGQA